MDLPPDSRTALRDWLTEQLADLLGEPLADVRALADDDDLLGCGLDSIRLMYLQERLRARGSTLDFAQLAQRPCLGAWLDLLACADRLSAPATVALPTAQDRDQPFELSSVQQAYWLGRGAGEVLGNVSCHAFLEFRTRDVDPQRLAAAAECVRQRHPMLRARFLDGRQQILPTPPLSCFDMQDWRTLQVDEAERDWQALRDWRAHECLAVERGQVFLLGLVRMPGGEDRLWLSLDLLAADVESLRLLLAELGVAYLAPERLAEPPALHFADYLARRAAQRAEAAARARDYWLERLPRLPDAPALPLACAPESIRQPRTRRLAFQLSAGESRRLERLAAQHGVTLSSVFGCTFALVLARWSESAEFLLNVPLFDRHADDPRIGEVIADFTTLLLLECRMQAGVSFAEAVKSFQRNLHGAIDHAAFPALEVLREARRRGQPRSAPVVFASNLGEEGFVPAAFRDAFGDLHDMLSQTPQVWLDHQLYRVGDGILLAWDSVVGLFPEGLPETMFEAYVGCSSVSATAPGSSPPICRCPGRSRRAGPCSTASRHAPRRAPCIATSSFAPPRRRMLTRCSIATNVSPAANWPSVRCASPAACAKPGCAPATRSRSACRADRSRSRRYSVCSPQAPATCRWTSTSRPHGGA